MWGNEILCWWIFMSGLVTKFDEGLEVAVNNAAAWIVLQYMHLSFMPAVGLSIAVTAIVGKAIGMGRIDLAIRRTWLGLTVTMIYMGICALGMVIFGEELMRVFTDQGEDSAAVKMEIVRLGAPLLMLAAVFQLFDAVAICLSGALRGAGDTVYPGVVTIISSWTLIVAGGWVMVTYFPGLGSIGPWIMAAAYIIVLAIALLYRFLRGGWKRITLVRDASQVGHEASDLGFSFQGSEVEGLGGGEV